jgi:hypothetical protein
LKKKRCAFGVEGDLRRHLLETAPCSTRRSLLTRETVADSKAT